MYTTLIQAEELARALDDQAATVLDCRARLGEPDWGRRAYREGHIPGARHADLDADLAAPPGAGGRHPLPDRDAWVARIRHWGITNASQVVVYDDAGGAFAARAWWMFRWAGHAAVALLDGGLQAWRGALAAGEEPAAAASDFAAGPSLTRTVSAADIQAQSGLHLVDARAEARFRGLEEPIDPVAGHIPGALCLPFQDNLTDSGHFKSRDELEARFAEVAEPVVCYCGSGVTAAHNVLAMTIAGLPEPALYPGSWSEWIRDPARPIEC